MCLFCFENITWIESSFSSTLFFSYSPVPTQSIPEIDHYINNSHINHLFAWIWKNQPSVNFCLFPFLFFSFKLKSTAPVSFGTNDFCRVERSRFGVSCQYFGAIWIAYQRLNTLFTGYQYDILPGRLVSFSRVIIFVGLWITHFKSIRELSVSKFD